jgi:phospholipid/cholesterol/gamma-HCH transport system substrate-binding protein
VTAVLRRLGLRRGFSFMDLNPVALGAVSLVLILGAVGTVFAVGQFGLLDDRYEMSGVFTDTSGLRRGDLVRMAGVEVGEVTGVHADFARGQVIVTWEVDKGVDLGPRTTAEISLATLLGGTYVRLDGDVTEPYMATLPAGERRIPLDRTKTPTSVDAVLRNTTRAVEQLDVVNVNALLSQLGEITTASGDDVARVVQGIAAVAQAVNASKEEVERLLASTETITGTLASKDVELAALVDHAAVLLDELARRRDDLAVLLGSGSEVVVHLSTLVSEHRASLEQIIDDVHATLDVLHPRLDAFNQQLAFLGPTFVGIASATRQGPWLDAIADAIPGADLLNLINAATGQGGP